MKIKKIMIMIFSFGVVSEGFLIAKSLSSSVNTVRKTPIISNNTETPQNIVTILFFNSYKKYINQIQINYGGQVEIPLQAAYVSGYFVASNAQHTKVPVLTMQPIIFGKSYSLTDPNSVKHSSAPWVMTQLN